MLLILNRMNQVVVFPELNLFFNNSDRRNYVINPPKLSPSKSCFHPRSLSRFTGQNCSAVVSSSSVCMLVDQAKAHSLVHEDGICDGFPHVQSLRNFPKEELFRKVVMVRFDAMILLSGMKEHQSLPGKAFSTIKYLHESGSKVILVGSWNDNRNSRTYSKAHLTTESVADFLSSILAVEVVPVKRVSEQLHSDVEDSQRSCILLLENLLYVKGERANCINFAKELASEVDIFVNDAFSECHKVLASTVGVASFCYACIAGFYFEESIYNLKKIINTTERPYMAVIGGGNLADKAAAVQFLATICHGLVFAGNMAFQILHALGVPVPKRLVELGSLKEAVKIVESAKSRNIPLFLPRDVWCIKDHIPNKMELVSVHNIHEGWQPIDIGPSSLEEMTHLLSKCKKIMWIGPLRFSSTKLEKGGTRNLAEALCTLSSCDVSFVGKVELEELKQKSKSFPNNNVIKSAAVVWEVLKGGTLPGLMALDRAYPFKVDWSVAYDDPMRPLVVDIGSGNGMFLFGMGTGRKHLNFLGLEINSKLVDRCIDDTHRLGVCNVHFLATNATSTFRSIISTYPGKLVLVSIQCPNPDFNKPQYRWRMLQRSLVEAIADLLVFGGKVFLQSDIEAVAVRMKSDFMEYGEGKFTIEEGCENNEKVEWLKENPFGVTSDWEKHVLVRGAPMYRILLCKI